MRWPKRKRLLSKSHERAPVQEREAAARIGGRTTKGSGSGYQKHDARSRRYHVECKTTKNNSFRVTSEMIKKLEEGSFGSDAVPVIEVELGLGEHRIYVVPSQFMDRLFEEGCSDTVEKPRGRRL